ncbi:MAG: hypothetical protein WEC75_00065 [Dehalococcoidia bacterium]
MNPAIVPVDRRVRAPRVLVVGRAASLRRDRGLLLALGGHTAVETMAPSAAWPLTYLRALRAARRHDAELVHLLDASLAPTGRRLRSRLGVPVTVSITADALRTQIAPSSPLLRDLGRLDEAFTPDRSMDAMLRSQGLDLPVTTVPPAIDLPAAPAERALRAVSSALRGVAPGRLILGVRMPGSSDELRWLRDAVLARLEAAPLCVLFGVADPSAVRPIVRRRGAPEFRVVGGPADDERIAAVARCVDAFVCIPRDHRTSPAGLLPLVASGAPVVAAADETAGLRHEHNAFVVPPGDDAQLVRILDSLLALPAIQRHALGEDFARWTLRAWPWEAPADVYVSRFAALVGRPRIPAELLRAA